MLKKITSIILILTMMLSLFAFNFSSSAATVEEEYPIMPCYTTINSINTSFSISGINATACVTLTAQYSTSLYIKIELQKEYSTGYETLETWEKSGTGRVMTLEEDRLINIFSDYRIYVTCKAGSETKTFFDYP